MRNLAGEHKSKKMHCQGELLSSLATDDLLIILDTQDHWFWEGYSTSKHLYVLYSIVVGLQASRIGEIGFGRSSFLLAVAAGDANAKFVTCDRYDYSWMLSDVEKSLTRFIVGDADKFFSDPEVKKGLDFIFLDYMSTRKKSAESCYKDLKRAVKLLPQNGIVAVHDAIGEKYNVAAGMKMLQKKYGSNIETFTLPYCSGLGLIRRVSKSPHGTLKDQWRKKPDTDRV